MGAEHQNRRSKRANVLTRPYSHDDKDIELAAKEEDELQQAIERSKRKDRERVPKEKRASPSVCILFGPPVSKALRSLLQFSMK